MDQQRRQKIGLAVLAILVLGAGSVFAIRAFGGPEADTNTRTGEVQQTGRRARATEAKADTSVRRKRRAKKGAVKSDTTARREKKKTSTTTRGRRARGRVKLKRLKKIEDQPKG